MWLMGKLVRCLREDVATDSLVGAWVTIYWGLHGHHLGAAAGQAHGLLGQRGQILKVWQSAHTLLILSP